MNLRGSTPGRSPIGGCGVQPVDGPCLFGTDVAVLQIGQNPGAGPLSRIAETAAVGGDDAHDIAARQFKVGRAGQRGDAAVGLKQLKAVAGTVLAAGNAPGRCRPARVFGCQPGPPAQYPVAQIDPLARRGTGRPRPLRRSG